MVTRFVKLQRLTNECLVCGQMIVQRLTFLQHLKKEHKDDLKYKHCERTFKCYERFRAHTNHHNDNNINSEVCGKNVEKKELSIICCIAY